MSKPAHYAATDVRIPSLRGQKVILDATLARIYGVPTHRLNEAVKRNPTRFPVDFVFQLTRQEVMNLKSQIAISSSWGGRRTSPYAFTEHGALMAADVLNSTKAVEMSVFVIRAFVRLRKELLSRLELEKRLDQIEKVLLVHDKSLRELYEKLRPLLLPPPEPEKKPIGFQVRERKGSYSITRRR